MKKRIKLSSHKEQLKKSLSNKDFKKEYALLNEEFGFVRDLIRARMKRNLTQKELSELAGVNQPEISRIETGVTENISLKYLSKICSPLGLKPVVKLIPQK